MLLGTARQVSCAPTTVGLAAAGLVLMRLPLIDGAFDRVWAEDGAVFLADARAHDLTSVAYVYSGYIHGVPRALALIGSWLPLSWYAVYVAIAAAAITGLCVAYVFGVARAHTPSTIWAVAAALALVLVPAERAESLGNLSNLQWMLLAACAWAAVDRRDDNTSRYCTSAVAFAAAITSPLAVLAVPALVVAQGKNAVRHPATIGLGGGLTFQALAIAFGPRSMPNPVRRDHGLRLGMIRDVLTQLGDIALVGKPVLVGAALVLMVVAAWLFGAPRNRYVLALVVTGGLMVVFPMVITGSAQARYSAAGFVIVVGAACLAVAGLTRVASGVVVAVLLTAVVLGFVPSAYRSSGPSWSAEVQMVESACPEDHPLVHYSPDGWPALEFPC